MRVHQRHHGVDGGQRQFSELEGQLAQDVAGVSAVILTEFSAGGSYQGDRYSPRWKKAKACRAAGSETLCLRSCPASGDIMLTLVPLFERTIKKIGTAKTVRVGTFDEMCDAVVTDALDVLIITKRGRFKAPLALVLSMGYTPYPKRQSTLPRARSKGMHLC